MRIGADGADLFRDQDLVDLLEFDGEETVEGVLELDAAIMAAPLSLPPASPRNARSARLTMSLIVVPSVAARARMASTKLGESLNVTAAAGSTTTTGRPIIWASSMYR